MSTETSMKDWVIISIIVFKTHTESRTTTTGEKLLFKKIGLQSCKKYSKS